MALAQGSRWVVQQLDLKVAPGTLHMILGERDTGKTAILEAFAGMRKLERGTLQVPSPAALVPQALPAAALRVIERFLLHRQPRRFGIGIRWKQAREEARALAARFGLEACSTSRSKRFARSSGSSSSWPRPYRNLPSSSSSTSPRRILGRTSRATSSRPFARSRPS
jgi:ABC-type taurine transport system ATPase subunit